MARRIMQSPRERLFNALPLLLWEPETSADPTVKRLLQTTAYGSCRMGRLGCRLQEHLVEPWLTYSH